MLSSVFWVSDCPTVVLKSGASASLSCFSWSPFPFHMSPRNGILIFLERGDASLGYPWIGRWSDVHIDSKWWWIETQPTSWVSPPALGRLCSVKMHGRCGCEAVSLVGAHVMLVPVSCLRTHTGPRRLKYTHGGTS